MKNFQKDTVKRFIYPKKMDTKFPKRFLWNNKKIRNIQLHCNPSVRNSLKFGESKSGSSPRGRWGGEVNFTNSKKKHVGKDEKNMHSKFHRDQMNVD